MLTGFQSVKENRNELATKSFRLGRGQSPFQDGVRFKVTDWDLVKPEVDGKVDKNAAVNPVFITTVGMLFVSMAVRESITADGKPIQPNGTFNELVRKYIMNNREKNDYEIMSTILEAVKDKEIVVSREFYVAKTRDGREYGRYLINLDFVK